MCRAVGRCGGEVSRRGAELLLCYTCSPPLLPHKSSGGWCLGDSTRRSRAPPVVDHTVGVRCLSLHSRAQKKVTMFPLALDLWCLGRTLRDQYLSSFLCEGIRHLGNWLKCRGLGLVQSPLVMPCPYSKNYTTLNSKTPAGKSGKQ